MDLGDSATCAHVCQGRATTDEVRLAFELGEARAQIEAMREVVEAAMKNCASDITVRDMNDHMFGDITVTCFNKDYVDLILALRKYTAVAKLERGEK